MNAALLIACSLLGQDLGPEQVSYLHTLKPAEFRLGEAALSLDPKHIKGDTVTFDLTQTTHQLLSVRDGMDPVELRATITPAPYPVSFSIVRDEGQVWALNPEEKRSFDSKRRTALGVTVALEQSIREMIALYLVCWCMLFFLFLDLSGQKATLKGYVIFYACVSLVWGTILHIMHDAGYSKNSFMECLIAGCIAIPLSLAVGWFTQKIKKRPQKDLKVFAA